MMFIYGALAVIVMAVILLYNLIYPNVSRLVVNNMCMLITAGMIMITRLSAQSKSPYGIAIRQLVFVVVGIVFGLIVPVLIRKMTFLENWTYIYAAVGGAASYRCIVCSNTWRSKAESQYWTCESAAFRICQDPVRILCCIQPEKID